MQNNQTHKYQSMKLETNRKKQQCEQQEIKLSNYLPDANPIKKRQKLHPHSIFPFYQLPKFNYNSNISEPTVINDTVNLTQDKLVIFSNSLPEVFKDPVYVYNNRASMKNNSQFGCMKVNYSQSKHYKKWKNIQSFTQYSQMNIANKKSYKQYQIANKQAQNIQESLLQAQKIQAKQQIYFQSRFQSGNLCFAAVSQTDNQPTYYLICSRDMNTSKCTQWFFFKTINKLVGKVTFHILNFVKPYSIFEYGMKVCYASKTNQYKWLRGCTDIKYRETNIPISKKSQKCYYALSFSYTYTTPSDNVYFSYCYPYTYTMLQEFLFPKSQTSSYIKRRNLAITSGGNNVDLITISNFKQKQHKKRIVFITSRVHPGQTPSSFICEGMMRYLLGESEEAQTLRDNFIFKFIPMLNPDGVINGSYRCSLSGYDLNRVWHRADKISHPEIYGARKAVFETNQVDKIFLFADLHAHSKKKGVFAYGCQDKSNPYICRQIPFLFWKNVPDFNYYQCNFMMRTGRQGTSRLFIYRELDIDYSYTIQHSFCGPSKQKIHYTPKDYIKIGTDYLKTFHRYFCRNKKISTQFQVFQELYLNKQLIKIGQLQQCSSSDQQLDKQKAPQLGLSQRKIKKPSLIKRQTLRMSQGLITKKSTNNFRRTNLQINPNSKQLIMTKFKQTRDFSGTMRPLPIVDPTYREKKEDKQQINPYISFRPRVCSSSLTGNSKPDEIPKKFFMKQTFRYDEQEDINSLTNLFLPSLTQASYKKYNRKSSSPKNMVHIGNGYLQNAILLKQQIKAFQRKKQNWKDQARSYL